MKDRGKALRPAGQAAALQHVYHSRGHAPPVIDRTARFVALQLPAAIHDAPQDTLVKFSPMPEWHCQRHRLLPVQTVQAIVLIAPRQPCVLAGDQLDAAFFQLAQRVHTLFPGPHQMNLGTRIGHPCAQRECIDARDHPVNGIIRNVSHTVIVGQRTRDCPNQKFSLINAAVIGAHTGMVHIQRAVEYLYLRMTDGRTQAAFHQLRRRGKQHVVSIGNGALNDLVVIFTHPDVVVALGEHPPGKDLIHMTAPEFMGIGPRAGIRAFFI